MSLAAICLVAGALSVKVPADHFTLVWRHSIEKMDWSEDYVVKGDTLLLKAAHVQGDGAGMDPPPDSVFDPAHAYWTYHPKVPPLPSLNLARSHFTQDYRFCVDGTCRPMNDLVPISAGGSLTVEPCSR